MEKEYNRNQILLLIPFSIVFIIFLFVPLIYGITSSVFTSKGFSGISNYIIAFKDVLFKKSIANTFIYVLGNILLSIISLLLAILIHGLKSKKLSNIYQTIMMFPYVMPMVVTGIIFKFIFTPQSGLFSGILGLFGLPTDYSPLSHALSAKIVIILVWVFVYTGYMVNIYYSSLRDIPKSYYEAAEIDGANNYKKAIYITIPLLSNIFIYTIVTGTILSFQIFPLIWIMTGSGFGLGAGGPDNSTLSLDLYIYQTAFRDNNLYLASAMGVIMMLLTYILALIPMKISKEVNYD